MLGLAVFRGDPGDPSEGLDGRDGARGLDVANRVTEAYEARGGGVARTPEAA